jgi:hypothetical protein
LNVGFLDNLGQLLNFRANMIRESSRRSSDRFDSANLRFTSFITKIVFSSAFSLRTIFDRMPAGPTIPNHTVTSYSGTRSPTPPVRFRRAPSASCC